MNMAEVAESLRNRAKKLRNNVFRGRYFRKMDRIATWEHEQIAMQLADVAETTARYAEKLAALEAEVR
jgi:hypothetical protein